MKRIRLLALAILVLIAFSLGYGFCLFNNGYGRLVIPLNATSSEDATALHLKLAKLATGTQATPVSELLGYTPAEICLQHPYMTEKAFREALKANTFRFQMIGDDVTRIWLMDDSVVAKVIDIPRWRIADLTVMDTGRRCMQGNDARFIPQGKLGVGKIKLGLGS